MSNHTHLFRIEADGPKDVGLVDWPAMNIDSLVSGNPHQRGHIYDEVEAVDYSVGVWECTAFVDQPGPYPVDEYMLLLEGSVEMVMPDGTEVTVDAGEAFVIPKGFECQWKMPQTVRKIFMILDGATPGDSDNLTLHRITKPPMDTGDPVPSGALATSTTHFLNHDASMRVYTDSFAKALHAPAPQTGRHLVQVLQGDVTFDDAPASRFKSGEGFYLLPGHDLTWRIAAGTRLLVSACTLPND